MSAVSAPPGVTGVSTVSGVSDVSAVPGVSGGPVWERTARRWGRGDGRPARHTRPKALLHQVCR